MLLLLYILLALITLGGVVLLKAYTRIPPKELKRRSLGGDAVAGLLFRAAAYGDSLKVLLWMVIGLGAAGFFVVLSGSVPSWLALIGSLALIWLGFAWLPNTRVSSFGTSLARWLAPLLAWLLNRLYPLLNWVAEKTQKYRGVRLHSGVYEKEDLLELLNRQGSQIDNRISDDELKIARGALSFGDKIIRDVMTPRKVVKLIGVNDAVGPVLMDELHKSGHSRFPVYEGSKDHIVGTLFLRDIMDQKADAHKTVGDLMHKHVYYMHDEEPLREALQAFLKTRNHLFVVVNNFEDIIGVVTLEDILEQIIGQPIVDEFDQYEDLRAVAARMGKKEHQAHQEHEETQEVVE